MLEKQLLSHLRLDLNIKMPLVEDVWLEGYDAAQHEEAEVSNPYPEGTPEHQYWCDGWWAGLYHEEPLFELSGEVNPNVVNIADYQQQNTLKNAFFLLKNWLSVSAQLVSGAFAAFFFYQVAELVM